MNLTGSALTTTPADDTTAAAGGTSPLAVVEAFGRAWADHDLDAAVSLLDPNCVFDATGPAPDGVVHVGLNDIRQAWKAIFADAA